MLANRHPEPRVKVTRLAEASGHWAVSPEDSAELARAHRQAAFAEKAFDLAAYTEMFAR